ncbi:hypothetical protein I302_107443 [Kwoniella bestiolae CBS 10118]|uniref:Kinetochore protein Mis13/DSN1 n=1 Tax=Kwoniella bestiolae CBS 10118 TaxID=1296100 RepID=A0A1B9FYI5_9TREE|nr:hypothetical protein I302_06816 [Kwoniella bestiolae CBS 10118]OCF23832.1 hypothetical protein I302_06816 [Kwoniella bestiolae CBS 10118]
MATRATTRPPPPPPSSILNFDSRSNMVSGKRKSMSTSNKGKNTEEDEPDKKKRKPATKKQPAFKPQPVPITNSSDTPPDDNDEDLHLLPPPSERKIARRRDSTREIRERQESPTPNESQFQPSHSSSSNSSKRIKTSSSTNMRSRSKSIDPVRAAINTSDDPLKGVEETESMKITSSISASGSKSRRVEVEGLSIPSSHPPQASGPRPTSPPRRTFSSSQPVPGPSTQVSMAPPKGFTRKTRQSMGREKGRINELSKESFIPLMESETPIIRKNQQLRGQQARRSSLDHRGGRASSSWGRGEITMPHKNVDSKLFYRHIPVSYPEPIKARMLLSWCANRALEESLKPASSSRRDKGKAKAQEEEGRTEEGDKMLKEIMDEFVREMNRGGVDTSVFGAPGQEPTITGLKPHPKNVSNRKVEAAANADIRKYKGEEAQWHALASATRAKQEDVISRLNKKIAADREPDMTRSENWMKDALSLAQGVLDKEDDELGESKGEFEDVEFKIDTLHQTSHVALQYVLQSSRFLDGIFSSLTEDLRSRDKLGLPSSSAIPENDEEGPDTVSLLSTTTRSGNTSTNTTSKKVDPMVLLRALASKESRNQNERLIERAMQIPPVTLSSSSSGTSSNVGSATPRRQNTLGTTTPRRPTGLTGQTPRTARRGMTPHGAHE